MVSKLRMICKQTVLDNDEVWSTYLRHELIGVTPHPCRMWPKRNDAGSCKLKAAAETSQLLRPKEEDMVCRGRENKCKQLPVSVAKSRIVAMPEKCF